MSPQVRARIINRESLDAAKEVFGNTGNIIRFVAEETIKSMRFLIEGNTPLGDPKTDPHSGQLKESWGQVENRGMSYSFTTRVPYASIVEEGLYPEEWIHPGGRLIKTSEGVFSTQAKSGMLQPLIDDPALVDQVVDLVVKKVSDILQNA